MKWLRRLLLRALELLALAVMLRWMVMRLRRVLLLPTGDTTEPITPAQVRPIRRIIVSDLHLGAGDRSDDFTADEEFIAFVQTYVQREEPVEFILAGDTFEFLQIRLPNVGDYNFSADAATRRLDVILAAHVEVVAALRTFLAQPGNILTVMIGNHDFELHYAAAKQLLRRALGSRDHDERMRFCTTYEGCGLYLEHGNQFDGWNTFIHFSGIAQPFEIVRGTRVVKDVINPLEEDPLDVATLIDNVKPTSAFLWYMLALPRLRNPQARRYVTRGLLRMFRTVAVPTTYQTRPVMEVREELLGAPGQTLQREMAIQTVYELEPELRAAAAAHHGGNEPELRLRRRGTALVEGVTRRFARGREAQDAALAALQVEAGRKLREEIREFKTKTQRGMARIAASTEHGQNALYVCGHTHLAEIVALGEDKTYINTGTWTEVIWNIAKGHFETRRFPFLEISNPDGARPVGRLLVWLGPDLEPQEWNDLDHSDEDSSLEMSEREEQV